MHVIASQCSHWRGNPFLLLECIQRYVDNSRDDEGIVPYKMVSLTHRQKTGVPLAAVRRYTYLWSFRAQAKPAPARPVRDTKRIPAHRWMVSPVAGLVPSLAARTWKAVSALPSSK